MVTANQVISPTVKVLVTDGYGFAVAGTQVALLTTQSNGDVDYSFIPFDSLAGFASDTIIATTDADGFALFPALLMHGPHNSSTVVTVRCDFCLACLVVFIHALPSNPCLLTC
jgi:hypothetical protein